VEYWFHNFLKGGVAKMKDKLALVLGVLLIFGMAFISCDTGNGTGGFDSQTVAVPNNVNTLGLTGKAASSNKTNIATAAIESGEIKITSVAEGYAIVMVTNGSGYAGISLSVSKTGVIAIVYISKYNGSGSGAAGGGPYNLLVGFFNNTTDEEVAEALSNENWANSIVPVFDGKYVTGANANVARTFFLGQSGFHLIGGIDGTWDYLLEYKYDGVGAPSGLKSAMSGLQSSCPIAGMFRNKDDVVVFYVSKNES
jgi:hypothetical protein